MGVKELTVFRAPVKTLVYFASVCGEYLARTGAEIAAHPVAMFVVGPLLVLLGVGYLVPGPHTPVVEFVVEEGEVVLWWVMLGVLSSVGLGTGMHSGLLFLFPYIASVCMTASVCESLHFSPRNLECLSPPGSESAAAYPVTFFGLWTMVAWPSMLWGAGTAIGEIPPYAISRAARLAGKANSELAEWTEAGGESGIMAAMRDWMFVALEKYGFWAILAFAAWPNMAFDLCGLACGHFLIPFWVFFGATFIGKALIKVNGQALFFIAIFRKEYLDVIISYIARITPDSLDLDTRVNEIFLKQKAKFMSHVDGSATLESPDTPLISKIWSVVMIGFISWFALSVVHSFAQQRLITEINAKYNKK